MLDLFTKGMNLQRSKINIPPDLNRSSIPRYVQLASLFRRRIEDGQWRIGDQIPIIDSLMEECGVARATIRQSLGILESEGLIERHRAKGTFVKKSPREDLWCEVQTDWSGLLLSREGATIEVLLDENGVVAPVPNSSVGQLAPSYRHLRRKHSRDGATFLIADIYVESTIAQTISKSAYRTKSALRLIADIPGVEIADARQILTIGSADIGIAQDLNISINDPIAFVQRCATDSNGLTLLVANGIYRGDRVRLDMRLK